MPNFRTIFVPATLIVAVACSSPSPVNVTTSDAEKLLTGTPQSIVDLDRRQVRQYDLLLGAESRLDALASEEIRFEGPFRDPDGPSYITVLATAAYAELTLKRLGFTPRPSVRQLPATLSSASTSGACNVPDKSTSEFLWDYSDYITEMYSWDSTPGVEAAIIGKTHYSGQDIVGVRFGPTSGASDAPTVYILGTQHAREWISTGVAIGIARELHQTLSNPTYRPDLYLALADTSIVVVPVVNPDGYEVTRTADRFWRGNLNTIDCPMYGVDLNRNHVGTWGEGADFTDISCTPPSSGFIGNAPASESETRAVEHILTGAGFELPAIPVALVAYHSFGDLVLYAPGYKELTDSFGPRCSLEGEDYCFNADFLALREIFGDTASGYGSPPLFVDGNVPFYRDHPRNILYASSGNVQSHATYHPANPFSAVNVELPNDRYGFTIECDPSHDTIISDQIAVQMNSIERLAGMGPGLIPGATLTDYLPSTIGHFASGIMAREYPSGIASGDARATFTKPTWRPIGVATLKAGLNGTTVSYQRARSAAHYDLHTIDRSEPNWNPLCLPCRIDSFDGEYSGADETPDCPGECVDLCDSNRLQNAGWTLTAAPRGPSGIDDCWWEPSTTSATLTYPGGSVPTNATHCHFSFSYENKDPFPSSSQFVVERQDAAGTWQTLWEATYTSPHVPGSYPIDGRLVSFAFDANTFLPSGKVPPFRIRSTGTRPLSFPVKVFDPVVYCRIGGLP